MLGLCIYVIGANQIDSVVIYSRQTILHSSVIPEKSYLVKIFPCLRLPAPSSDSFKLVPGELVTQRSATASDTKRPVKMESEKYSSSDDKLELYLHILSLVFFLVVPFSYIAMKNGAIASLIATCHVTSGFLLAFILCDVMLRVSRTISLMEVDPPFGQNSSSIIRQNFALNTTSAVIVVISVLLFLIFSMNIVIRRYPLKDLEAFEELVYVPLMAFSFYLLRITNLAEWEKGPTLDLDAMKGLDYGTGMAYSYYYGYLRLILPNPGTTYSKGISEKIENFEDKHNVTFPVHKLFILIPSSGYIPPNLKEASEQWMESAQELEEEKRDRAGTIGRTYRNNVYKIYSNGRNSGASPVYVVVEGATPLLTFYEVQKHSHPESIAYRQYRNEITMRFYQKLRKILQSEPDTRNLCELIYYNDCDSKEAKVNVAKVILERISKITSSS